MDSQLPIRKIPRSAINTIMNNNNLNNNLMNFSAYKKKILTDQKQIEKILLREIQLACEANGYRLLEIKIEKL